MKAFAYAAPRSTDEALDFLNDSDGQVEFIAGGTDLVGLLRKMVIQPDLVMNLLDIDELRGIERTSEGLSIGAVTTLDEVLASPLVDEHQGIKQAIQGINSRQLQCQGTFGGELCQRPRCWYFRAGQGLLAERGRMVAQGENRYHAILGNAGAAKFVSASRIAPVLIALGARVRIVGPTLDDESVLPLEFFYRTPKDESQRENILVPGQFVTHVLVPPADGLTSATYEARHGVGPDYPLAAAAAALRIEHGVVAEANIVLGHVAPVPWMSPEAAAAIIGRAVTPETAAAAGHAAVAKATPLSQNEYKVQLARVAVKRAILLAAGLETGGF